MHSPIWKPGILIVLILLSYLFAVESAVRNQTLQKSASTRQASVRHSTSNGRVGASQKNKPISQAPTKKTSNAKLAVTSPRGSKSWNQPLPKSKSTVKKSGNNVKKVKLSPASTAEMEKKEFLDAHNKIRSLHGEPPYTWDPKLELFAKQYFAQHYNDCKLVHSGGPYGENLFWGSGNKWKASDAVTNWAGENKYYKGASNACQEGKMCGHYTQIVWRDSIRLGCDRSICKTGDTYIICEYDPPGNYDGESPFDAHT